MRDSGSGGPDGAIRLRRADRSECAALTGLCRRSKAMWGYDDDFLDRCRGELTVHPSAIDRDLIRVAETGSAAVGVAELAVDGHMAEVEKLFVEPAAAGSGAGRALMNWLLQAARQAGARRLEIASDPNAAGFYRRFGAVDAGEVASGSIAGRVLPRLIIDLT
jgi:GNAT superfamily N-acetyltransferase